MRSIKTLSNSFLSGFISAAVSLLTPVLSSDTCSHFSVMSAAVSPVSCLTTAECCADSQDMGSGPVVHLEDLTLESRRTQTIHIFIPVEDDTSLMSRCRRRSSSVKTLVLFLAEAKIWTLFSRFIFIFFFFPVHVPDKHHVEVTSWCLSSLYLTG